MKKLLNGIVEFREKVRSSYLEKYIHLALAQAPDALLIACSDSRVVPNVFASTDPGDLFVVRNMGNLVPPCPSDSSEAIDDSESAALEFALASLPIRNIIICGHSECGAMQALLSSKINNHTFLGKWLRHGAGALERLSHKDEFLSCYPHQNHNQLSQLNVLQQMEHVMSYPFVQERMDAGTLKVHGWWFDIQGADVYTYDVNLKQFILIDDQSIHKIQEEVSTLST